MNSLADTGRALAATAVLATLAACGTVGPDYQVPQQAVIQRQSAAAPFLNTAEAPYTPAPLPPHWWRLYHDAQLDGLIEQAFAANTDLRVAAANLARARAVLQEAGEAGKPVLGVSAAPGVGRSSAAARGIAHPLPDAWNYDAGVSVSYQFDLYGKIARAVESATADTQAAQAAYDLVRVTVAADTARAYADACAAARQAEVARHSIVLQQRFVQLTAERIRAGRGTATEDARARAQLEQFHAALPPLLAQQRTALYRLAALTGRTPGEMAAPAAQLQCQAAPRLATQIPVGDGAALLRRRPDIRQAERALASATARIGVATADLYPSISLGASLGSTGLLDQFGAANATRWSLGPLISWTVPHTGSARSRVAQAKAGGDAALARFDGVVLNALREVEGAMTVYARELDRNAALKAAREQGEMASRQSHRLYQAGRIDFLSVLDADRSLASMDAAWAASDAQLAADQIALFLALGGGWEPAATRPPAEAQP
ncbi:efflux transporter outer membrane subunit [Oxalobacteraceae bacterium A2-2]